MKPLYLLGVTLLAAAVASWLFLAGFVGADKPQSTHDQHISEAEAVRIALPIAQGAGLEFAVGRKAVQMTYGQYREAFGYQGSPSPLDPEIPIWVITFLGQVRIAHGAASPDGKRPEFDNISIAVGAKSGDVIAGDTLRDKSRLPWLK
jgi:hypothetical protein